MWWSIMYLSNKLTLIKNYAKPSFGATALIRSRRFQFAIHISISQATELKCSCCVSFLGLFKMKSDEIIEKIRNKLKESDPAKRTVVNTFQFNFTDSEGQLIKSMVFDFKALDIYEGKASDADGKITIADEDFYLVGTKQTTFEQILQQEKAKLEGDAEAINKMLQKFRLNSIN